MKTIKLVGGLLAAAFVTVASAAEPAKKPARVPTPAFSVNKDKADKCVEPTEEMRRNHMNYILHQRDDTMHRGIRTVKHSLKNCVECHADPKTGSVLGKNGFCESCHQYAAVAIDCFSCHTDKAGNPAKATAGAGSLEQLVRQTAPVQGRKP